ncbi:MAG: 2Fe-2S iron-sulfur cluster binding domain-containing protein [Rhizobiales bacterium]|nr:2Fe-2S iron-sulfur cluster binding domain-containing protein [Hyphomicrobiales bacterium]
MRAYRVTLSNRDNRVLEVRENETIIDMAEAAGLVLPVACRYGGCITCAARMIEGRVSEPGGTALSKRQRREGYVLLCVARPRADCVIEVGVESHGKLFINPFAIQSSTLKNKKK